MATIPVILNLSGREVQVTPSNLQIRMTRTSIQQGRTERGLLLVPVEVPDKLACRVKYMSAVAPGTEEHVPAKLLRIVDHWLYLHTKAVLQMVCCRYYAASSSRRNPRKERQSHRGTIPLECRSTSFPMYAWVQLPILAVLY
jgi:hypothetical protein